MEFKNAALLIDGAKTSFEAKLASSLIRYKAKNVSCLIDSKFKDKTVKSFFDIDIDIPIKESIKEIKNIDYLIISSVLPSGKVPEKWITEINYALESNIHIINPLHIDFTKFINSKFKKDPGSSKKITKFINTKAKIYNVREVPDDLDLLSLDVLKTSAKRILTVGTDCNIGKMVTTIELTKAFNKKASFIATGQISTLIKGRGIAIDRVISDFLPGSVEKLILEEKNKDILFIEGQGSIFQPIYSCVSMGLLHGSAPDAMIMCHLPSRKKLKYTNINMPDIKKAIRIHEELASIVNSSKVIGISLNCFDLNLDETKDLIKKYEDITGLPTVDPIKIGVEKLIKPIESIL
jgi:uncharacterized NAD-dependent epimerase/dehydratase family protein